MRNFSSVIFRFFAIVLIFSLVAIIYLFVFLPSVCFSEETGRYGPIAVLPESAVKELFQKYSLKKYGNGPAKFFIIMSTSDQHQVRFVLDLLALYRLSSGNSSSPNQNQTQFAFERLTPEVHFFFDDFDESGAFSWIMLCENKEFQDFLTGKSENLSPRKMAQCKKWYDNLERLSDELKNFLGSFNVDLDKVEYPVLVLPDGKVFDYASLGRDLNAYFKVIDSFFESSVKDRISTQK